MKKILSPLSFLVTILIGSMISYFVVTHWFVYVSKVQGNSMYPTYKWDDTILVKRYLLLYRQPTNGDVVVIWNVEDNNYDIKRIAGCPGEVVRMKNGTKKYVLNKDQFFVLGDNKRNSYDSRYYGPIHRVQIVGIVE